MKHARYTSPPNAARHGADTEHRVTSLGLLAIAAVAAGCAAPADAPDPRGRIDVPAIDETTLVALPGNTHPDADAQHSLGQLDDGYLIEHMQLVLQRSPEQEAALDAELDALEDATSPVYHHWLTAQQFGDRYGVSTADLTAVGDWLRSHGFHVDSVPPSRMFVEFSGTAAEVREAFHTQLDYLSVDGALHFGNRSDPEIPAELAKVVAGVYALHDFMPHAMHRDLGKARRDRTTGAWSMVEPAPDFTFTNAGTNYQAVAPADFATLYNLSPVFAEGITGAGQTIVVIEDTNMKTAGDVASFRASFGLSGYHGTFTQLNPAGPTTCNNPGVTSAEGEAAIDAEWAGASAPDAAVELASCQDTMTVFGGLIALENLLNGGAPVPQIVSISYGECESANGNAANQMYVNTYQQAAMAGVSVFVSTGDDGAAACDANKKIATHGIAVSGFASTGYNVAVGGTDLMDYYDSLKGGPPLGTYWSASNGPTFGSALSYVPEVPWNDSCTSALIDSLEGYATGYGPSGFCASASGKAFQTTAAGSGGPSNYSLQPAWQTGVFGLPTKTGGTRYLPDVALFAANGVYNHFYVYCMTDGAEGGGVCNYNSASDTVALAAGGTSFAAPAMAGIQALINQKMNSAQGNPNPTYYKLAAAEYGARGSARCDSSGGTVTSPVLPAPGCIFHDVTQGDMAVNCTGPNCFDSGGTGAPGALSTSGGSYAPAYAAGTGWDYATGIGTVNAYNLVTAWSN